MKIVNGKRFDKGWRNIKALGRFKWYRWLTGGEWFCSITHLSWSGYYRVWSRQKPDSSKSVVHIEIKKGALNYAWNRPGNKPILLPEKDGMSRKNRRMFYSFKTNMFIRQSKLTSHPVYNETD